MATRIALLLLLLLTAGCATTESRSARSWGPRRATSSSIARSSNAVNKAGCMPAPPAKLIDAKTRSFRVSQSYGFQGS